MPGKVRIGISGWTYKPWRGVFYPAKLGHKRELQFAARKFSSIEINGTFYSLQRPSSFARWTAETPDDFVFAIKGSRYLTHMLKLRNARTPLANFFASGPLALGRKLGPILWQFPPRFAFDLARMEAFFDLLPRTTSDAALLAADHDPRVKGRVFLEPIARLPIRYAVEIRHPSFVSDEFITLLRRHRIALVCADTVAWPLLMDVTADFIYVRLHGSEQLYASGYESDALDRWAERIRAWVEGGEAEGAHTAAKPARARKIGRDVYVYFDNDMKVRAPFDALALMAKLGLTLPPEGLEPE
jgi:uncharacterized protein YecE (DUF72 family)